MLIRTISKDLQEIAEKELNEIPSRIPEDLNQIREWIEKQPHLNCRTEDQFLINFLRGCKYSLERTKEKLDNFYTTRSMLPEYFENRNPFLPELQEILESGVVLPLPHTVDGTGPRIFFLNWSNSKINKMTMINITKIIFMIMDIMLLEDDSFVICGMSTWSDCTIFPLGYILQITPIYLKKSITYAQESFPSRLKGIHVTNIPAALESCYNLVKTFQTEKMKKRMSFHSGNNMKSFEDVLPKKYWFKEFGGENGSIPDLTKFWKKKIESYSDWFREDDKYRAYENLRLKPKTSADMFGIEGSFRKLDLD